MSQKPQGSNQGNLNQPQNQPQGQFYQGQGQGQTSQSSSQLGNNQYQQQGTQGQTYQGQPNQWQQGNQGQTTPPSQGLSNLTQNNQKGQSQQQSWQQPQGQFSQGQSPQIGQQNQQAQPTQQTFQQQPPQQQSQAQNGQNNLQQQPQNQSQPLQPQQGQNTTQWQQGQPQTNQNQSNLQPTQPSQSQWPAQTSQSSNVNTQQGQQGNPQSQQTSTSQSNYQQNPSQPQQGQGSQWQQGPQNQQNQQNNPPNTNNQQPSQAQKSQTQQTPNYQGQSGQPQTNTQINQQPSTYQGQSNSTWQQGPQNQQAQGQTWQQGAQGTKEPQGPQITQGSQGQSWQGNQQQVSQNNQWQGQQPQQSQQFGQQNQQSNLQPGQTQNNNNQSLPINSNSNQNSPQKQSEKKDKKDEKKEKQQKEKDKKAQKQQKEKQKKEKEKKEKEEKEKKEKEEKEKKQKEKKAEKEKKGQASSPQKKPQGSDKKPGQNLEQAPLQSGTVDEIPKNLTSNQIIAFMKKKPYNQKIGNIEYTYSLLSKKQASFVMAHDRFLYLKGYQSIAYAREFDPKSTLPYTEEQKVPKAKTTFPLTQIEKFSSDQEKLTIQFSGAKKVKWQFVCPSKDCSLKWKRKIEAVKKTLDEFKSSGATNFDDFIRAKEANSIQQNVNQQNNTNAFLSTPYNPNQSFDSPNKSQFNNSTYQSSFNQNTNQNSNQNNNQNFNQNYSQQGNNQSNIQGSLQNPNRPTTVSYEGPQAARINNFIEGGSPQKRPYLNQSMSRIPWEGKEDIKNDILKRRRNWIDELLGGQEQVELVVEFKNYVQRIAEVIVNQLYVPQEGKMYPYQEFSREFASYVLDDIYVEIYFVSEDNPNIKNHRYKTSVNEFKNFEYLLGATKNEGILKVPFMTLFEYKGFLGMAKSKIGDGRGFKNKEFFEIINRRQFEDITRISAQILLNESKCKIVSYDRKNNVGPRFSTQSSKVYFVERLTDFLPQSDKDLGQDAILRRELVSDEQFQDQVFRDRTRAIKNDKITAFVDKKISELVSVLENEETYFTNSQQLTQLIHLYGLNVHHLGAIFKKTRLSWLKKIFQAEIAARCLKNIYRMDLQNSVLKPYNQNPQERQEERERNRVLSFLNVIFGNTEPTFVLWSNINNAAISKFRTKIWDNQFTNVNTGYLLQAVQTHFKILLTQNVAERFFFKSMGTFGPRDFIKFNFDATIYNLDFTNTFQLIHESIEERSFESFQTIGEILTKESSNHVSYLELLKDHPIHERISLFFLDFISPEDNSQLYNKIESKYLPHKFLYQSKFAQIKWFLKSNNSDKINRAASYIEEHARKWLGQLHPLFTQLNRMLAEYFSETQVYYSKALKYATASLNMQQALFEGDGGPLWRDYYLIGKIHYVNSRIEEALTYLTKAKNLVKVENLNEFEVYGELCLMLAKGYFGAKYYKESYSTVRELYKTIRDERDERSLVNIVEAVALIKQLLEINQEHESYYKFVESDFSSIVFAFADYPSLMNQSIKMITIPYLKNVILRNSKNKVRLLSIIEEISKIKQSPASFNAYIKAKISEGTFPKSYLHCLKEIDSVIDEILANQMIERWKSFNNLANQSILDKIGNSQINRGFDFLANMTALFNLLGQEVLEELFIMEK